MGFGEGGGRKRGKGRSSMAIMEEEEREEEGRGSMAIMGTFKLAPGVRFNPSQIGFEPSAIGRQSQVARLTNPATVDSTR